MKERDNKEILSDCGIKNTRQRHLILDSLKASDKPLTAEQIYFETRAMDHSMSLSTVYRTLEMFLEKSVVSKTLTSEQNKAYYVINEHEHRHHMICIECKSMTAIEGCPMAQFESMLSHQTDFQVVGHHLEIYGYCNRCREHNHDENKGDTHDKL